MTEEPPSEAASPAPPPDPGVPHDAVADAPAEAPAAHDPFDGEDWGSGIGLIGRSSTPSAGDATPRVRQRVRIKKIHRRRRRVIRYTASGLGLLVLLTVGWMLYTGLSAKAQLETVRDEVRKLRTEINQGDLDAARTTADQIGSHARQAYQYTTDPLWSFTASIPFVGRPIQGARIIAASIDMVANSALPALVDASKSIDPKDLRAADGTIDLEPLVQAQPVLDKAVTALNTALAQISKAPSSTWLPTVNDGRKAAIKELTPLTKTVSQAELAVDVLPSLLGQNGVKHYMISFENEAELRGTGGLAGAFAIISADHGKITFDKFEPDNTLDDVTTGLDFGSDFNQTYDAADVTGDYRDANLSPNFPYAAQIWIAEWKKVSGQTLDGAITLDPTALSYLLKVTGPAKLPAGSVVPSVSSSNVVELTQQRAYADFGKKEKTERKAFLLDIAKAVSVRLSSRTGNTTGLVKAAGKAASEHRLLFWTSDPAIEALIAGSPISGVTPVTPAPYAQVAINNSGGNKLDYYTTASMAWAATGCGSTRRVTVTLTVTNNSPLGLSPYVLGSTGKPGFPQNPGDNALIVTYYGTQGGELAGVLVDNQQSTAQSGREKGHPVFTVDLALARGSTHTIVLNLTEPGTGTPIVRLQPMVTPMTSTASAARC